MNKSSMEFKNRVKKFEKEYLSREQKSPYIPKFHVLPPVGWLNDPNGLCYFKDSYHVFFQYSPFDVRGGLKYWGHAISKDLLQFEYLDIAIAPDNPLDYDGVYSGSSIIEDNELNIFYTGNVKHIGDYDYINSGRESNIIKVTSDDGINFTEKKLILSNKDYPSNSTLHVRDPKVFKTDESIYRMVLGARDKDNKGCIFIYESDGLDVFSYKKTITTDYWLGYMWECPDMFELDGRSVVSISPQGVEKQEYNFQNVYSSGYFLDSLNDYIEWDKGFDFYAPQTFLDSRGRRLLIGWAGVPDSEDEYWDRNIEYGLNHCLSLPRELRVKDGIIKQYPIDEVEKSRKKQFVLENNIPFDFDFKTLDLEIKNIKSNSGRVKLGEGFEFSYSFNEALIELDDEVGAGRRIRKAIVKEIEEIRIIIDNSIAEIFLNKGETVFTTRFFNDSDIFSIIVSLDSDNILCYKL